MSVDISFGVGPNEEGDDEEGFYKIAGLIDWIPGVSTTKALWNWGVDPVANAVKLTKSLSSTSSLITAAFTFGSSFLTKIMANPIAADSFFTIAENDELWAKYCAKIAETNTIVTCSVALAGLRKQLQQKNKERKEQSGPRDGFGQDRNKK
jgi:hypothetical protein